MTKSHRYHRHKANVDAKPNPGLPVIESLPPVCQACGVRALSICSALTDEELASLEAIHREQTYAAAEVVFFEGDPARHVYNVTQGTVRLSKLLADGRRLVTGFLLPGDFLGLARNESYSYTAEAVDDVTLCRFAFTDFEALFKRFPQLERRLLARASNELAEAQEQMLLLGRKSPAEKLASFLLRMRAKAVQVGQPPNPLRLSMRRSDIADYLGMTTETVSRTFTKFRSDGYLKLPDPNTVVFKDLEKLAELTE